MRLKNFYLILFLVTSCVSLPNVQKDISNIQDTIPHKWKNIKASNNTIKIPDNWWVLFKDDKLNKIVDTALTNNNQVQVALLNIQRQLISSGQAVTNMIPNFRADGSFNKSDNKNKNFTNKSYSGGFSVSYQIDLFGKLLNNYQATNLMTRSSAEDAYKIGLAIVRETIVKYWTVALLNEEISLLQEALKNAQQTLKIQTVQYKVGVISKMDYLNAQNSFMKFKFDLVEAQNQKENTYNDLITLMSLSTDSKLDIPNKLPKIKLPQLPTEYPLIVLGNRPDVRQAQLKLEASLLKIKVMVKSFYPNITFNAGLSGNNGSSQLKLTNLMKNTSKALTLGFDLPVLSWPENYLKFKSSKVDYAENLINFKYTVANALAEVENAFYNFNILENQYKLSQKSYINSKQIEKAMKVRYKVGEESFENYLSVKDNTINLHKQELEYRLNIYKAYITKILALGGSTRAEYKASELKEKYDK